MRKVCVHTHDNIISLENLLAAWREFVKGKRKRKDVQEFERNLMHNIIALHRSLVDKTYRHAGYHAFNISDPKPRNIHKAQVKDRLVHHAIYRALYPFFDAIFISHSYSCRRGKGVHKAIDAFRASSRKISLNHTRTVWVLKCDIRKFFASIDHVVLKKILGLYIYNGDIFWLLGQVIDSFSTNGDSVGLPLGNLTSQLFVNIYMNEFDQFVKHKLKARYYIRYADDFAIMSEDKRVLVEMLPKIEDFLAEWLKLVLHPDKVFIKTVASGVDFLGWVHFLDHRVLRTATKHRIMKKVAASEGRREVVTSYIGMLSHGNGYHIKQEILKKLNTP